MGTTIITALVGLFCTLISGVVTFLLTKRKYNAEVNSQQIENMNKSFDGYKKMTEETLAMQNKKMAMQDEKIKQLQEENTELRKQLHSLQMQMASWINALCFDTTCQLRKAGLSSNLIHPQDIK